MSFGTPTGTNTTAGQAADWWAAVRAGDRVALARQLQLQTTAGKRARLESRAPPAAGARGADRAQQLTAVQWLAAHGTGTQHERCRKWLLSVGAAPQQSPHVHSSPVAPVAPLGPRHTEEAGADGSGDETEEEEVPPLRSPRENADYQRALEAMGDMSMFSSSSSDSDSDLDGAMAARPPRFGMLLLSVDAGRSHPVAVCACSS
jgi:hypothetical protein